MRRFALRRLLWALPTLVGISLVVFIATSLLPDPNAGVDDLTLFTTDLKAFQAREEARALRTTTLPRFFNPNPKDLKARVDEAISHLNPPDDQAALGAYELGRLGGSALPLVIPKLAGMGVDERAAVSLALAPVAERMGLGSSDELFNAKRAPVFWSAFWEDRSLEFTAPSVERTLDRVLHRSGIARIRDLIEVDTFALPAILRELDATRDVAEVHALTGLAAHVTGRGPVTSLAPSEKELLAAKREWHDWWYVHAAEFTILAGPERVVATVGETRYGKWIARTVRGELGTSLRDGRPVREKLAERLPITLALASIALLFGTALAVPLAVVSAWRRGKALDHAIGTALFALYSLPAFAIAQIFARALSLAPESAAPRAPIPGHLDAGTIATDPFGGPHPLVRILLAALCMTITLVVVLSRYQRAALLEVLGQDYVRTARAKGVSRFRILFAHALRNAIMPTVTLAGLQLPALVGAAFVVEEVFGLPGLGWESVRAVEAYDTDWLIGVLLFVAILATVGIFLSDLLYAALDPRIRESKRRDA